MRGFWAQSLTVSLALAVASAGADDEMVSVGSLRPVPLRSVGGTLSIITREQIESRGQPLVSDLLREVPGVSVNRTGPVGGVTQVRIRGAEGNHTLVLIDGIEANDPANDSEFNFNSLMTTNIERIEVLRGPQSALYGSDSVGGVINIVTREAERQGLRGDFEAEGGSFYTGRVAASLSAATESTRLFASGAYFRTHGVNAARTGTENDGYEDLSITTKGSWTPDSRLRFDGVFRWDDDEAQDDATGFGSPPAVSDARNETDPRRLYARLQGEAEMLSNWTARAGVAITDTHLRTRSPAFGPGGSRGRRVKLDLQSSYAAVLSETFDNRLTLRFERDWEQFQNLFAGGDASRKENHQTSGIAEYRLGWNDRVSFAASVRYDGNRRFDDEVLYRGELSVVLPWETTRFRVSGGKADKDPGFFDLFGFSPGQFIGNPDLEAETSLGFDVGVDQSFLDNRVSGAFTYYQSDLRNEIGTEFISVPTPPFFLQTTVNNRGRSKRRGFEIEASSRLLDNLDAHVSYTYALSKENDGGGYTREVRRPRHVASLNLSYRFLRQRALVDLSVLYNGRQYDTDFTLGFTPVPAALDDYTLINLAGSFRLSDRVELLARIDNLLDEDYEEVFGFNTPGIGAFGGVRVRWGGN